MIGSGVQSVGGEDVDGFMFIDTLFQSGASLGRCAR